jgi:hypothetical protein
MAIAALPEFADAIFALMFASALLICPTVALGANQIPNLVMITPSSISSVAAGVGVILVIASSAGVAASPGSAGLYELDEVETLDMLEMLDELKTLDALEKSDEADEGIDEESIELAAVDAGTELAVCNELLTDELVFVEPPPQPCSAMLIAITKMTCVSMMLSRSLCKKYVVG